jgi:hypothetical protein
MSSGRNSVSEMGFDAVVLSNSPLLVERDNSLPRSRAGRFCASWWSVVLLSTEVALKSG